VPSSTSPSSWRSSSHSASPASWAASDRGFADRDSAITSRLWKDVVAPASIEVPLIVTAKAEALRVDVAGTRSCGEAAWSASQRNQSQQGQKHRDRDGPGSTFRRFRVSIPHDALPFWGAGLRPGCVTGRSAPPLERNTKKKGKTASPGCSRADLPFSLTS